MDKFCIITNPVKDENYTMTQQIQNYMSDHGKQCVLATSVQDEYDNYYTDRSSIPEGTECAIVLGGDGTIIQAASDLVNCKLPILGINFGTLGFLAEVEQHHIIDALDALFEDRYEMEARQMLHGNIMNGDDMYYEGLALNDIVITRSGFSRIITMEVYVNGKRMTSYRGDGVIISTPTGSTGYNLSAGGPIVKPDTKATIITPICPHSLNARSIIVSANDEIHIRIGKSKKTQLEEAIATFDGRAAIQLKTEDTIVIRKAVEDARLIKVSKNNFFDILRTKLGECEE